MAKIIDSSDSLEISVNIASSKSNNLIFSAISSNLKYGSIVFDDPHNIFQQFREVIDENLEDFALDEKYFYMPERLAKDIYGSSDLWWLVLMANNMITHRDFCVRDIKVVTSGTLDTIESILNASKEALGTTTTIEDLTLYPVRV